VGEVGKMKRGCDIFITWLDSQGDEESGEEESEEED
jgi:hypothetical protein